MRLEAAILHFGEFDQMCKISRVYIHIYIIYMSVRVYVRACVSVCVRVCVCVCVRVYFDMMKVMILFKVNFEVPVYCF